MHTLADQVNSSEVELPVNGAGDVVSASRCALGNGVGKFDVFGPREVVSG